VSASGRVVSILRSYRRTAARKKSSAQPQSAALLQRKWRGLQTVAREPQHPEGKCKHREVHVPLHSTARSAMKT
jgi:hypothetical protein